MVWRDKVVQDFQNFLGISSAIVAHINDELLCAEAVESFFKLVCGSAGKVGDLHIPDVFFCAASGAGRNDTSQYRHGVYLCPCDGHLGKTTSPVSRRDVLLLFWRQEAELHPCARRAFYE